MNLFRLFQNFTGKGEEGKGVFFKVVNTGYSNKHPPISKLNAGCFFPSRQVELACSASRQ